MKATQAELRKIRDQMKAKGWSYRSAAPVIGRDYAWIWRVLHGKATSQPVIDAVRLLPRNNQQKHAIASQ